MPPHVSSHRSDGAPTHRVPNADRRAATRSAVLDATIRAVVKYGYAGATSARIAELSGYTRGAQMHHFDTKAAMVSEALVHLHENRMNSSLGELEEASRHGLSAFLQALWETFQNDLFVAAAELRVAARNDEKLQAVLLPAEQKIGRRIQEFVSSALDDGRHESQSLEEVSDHIVNVLRGMAFQQMLHPREARAEHQLEVLEEAVRLLLDKPL